MAGLSPGTRLGRVRTLSRPFWIGLATVRYRSQGPPCRQPVAGVPVVGRKRGVSCPWHSKYGARKLTRTPTASSSLTFWALPNNPLPSTALRDRQHSGQRCRVHSCVLLKGRASTSLLILWARAPGHTTAQCIHHRLHSTQYRFRPPW